MRKETKKGLWIALCMLGAFLLWTIAVSFIDVAAIGPQGSEVGFATLNRFVHRLTGVHMSLYTVTDWLGLVPIGFIVGFGFLGLVQWIKRKKLRYVDRSIPVLGGFYIVVLAAYVFFEMYVVNYRPVLIEGFLEASYPSSTTMLVMCVMPTAIMQLRDRMKNRTFREICIRMLYAFTIFTVLGRLISGVHWFSDIIGAALLSSGLVMMYKTITEENYE